MIDKWIGVPMAQQYERANQTVRVIIGMMMIIVGLAIRSEPPTRGTVLMIEQHALFGIVNVAVLGVLLIVGGIALILLRKPRPIAAWVTTTPFNIYCAYTVYGWATGQILLQGAVIYIAFCALIPLLLFMWSVHHYEHPRN